MSEHSAEKDAGRALRGRLYRARLAVEKWLWSGPRRAGVAKHLPLFICDVDGAYLKRKLREPDWFDSLEPAMTRGPKRFEINSPTRTWGVGTTIVRSWPWGDDARVTPPGKDQS